MCDPDVIEGPCSCCGRSVDDCICPECPECQTYGDPDCYKKHGLKYNRDQLIGQAKIRISILEDQIVDDNLYIQSESIGGVSGENFRYQTEDDDDRQRFIDSC